MGYLEPPVPVVVFFDQDTPAGHRDFVTARIDAIVEIVRHHEGGNVKSYTIETATCVHVVGVEDGRKVYSEWRKWLLGDSISGPVSEEEDEAGGF